MPKLLTEFVGTFFLVLTIGLTGLIGTAFAPIAIGTMLTALVYMGGHVSGAHYNPAVTLAVWMHGKIGVAEGSYYVVTQVAASLAASLVVYVVNDRPLLISPAAETSVAEFFLMELLFTFVLVLVIFNVAMAKGTVGNEYYGLAIGFVVLGGAFAAGPISGGAFNPAVAIGFILVDLLAGDGETLSGLWVYLVACFGGGILAALMFKAQSPA